MENFDGSVTETGMKALREGIKNKYKEYHSFNNRRFSKFEYNTNRTNYTPLRESFEEEFYVVRGIDRASPNIHIPSTNTLALLFTDDSYVPGKKILNTCRSYAEGKSSSPVTSPISASINTKPATDSNSTWWTIAGFVFLAGLVTAVISWFIRPAPSGLVIDRPTAKSIVQQELIVEGKAVNAETVWLVVHPEKSPLYWVQPAVKVQSDGSWISVIFIGRVNYEDAHLTYQVRAFVNPAQKLISGTILKNWPEAELGSDTLRVIKGLKAN